MKKGFTLIELLAVIVILAVIALIAMPTILGVVENAKKGSIESSAKGYVDAVNNQIAINSLDSNDDNNIEAKVYSAPLDSKYNISVKGQVPKSGWIEVSKNGVSRYNLEVGDYTISYNGRTTSVNKTNEKKSVKKTYPNYVYTNALGSSHIGLSIDDNVGKQYFTMQGDIKAIFLSEEECKGATTKCIYEEFITYDLDYKTEPDSNWTHYFKLGLDDNGIITSASLCGTFNGKNFCVDRTSDGSKHEQNKNTLLDIFGKSNCYRYSKESTDINCRKDGFSVYSFTNGTIGFNECFSNYNGILLCS